MDWYTYRLRSRLSRRRLLQASGLAAGGLAAAALVGCGDDDGPSGTGEPAESPTGGPLAENQLFRGYANEPTEIGPGSRPSSANNMVRSLAYNGLYIYNENFEVIPGDAEDMPETSDDGLLHTIRLRSDLKWHDGTPYNANDYVYTVRDIQLGALNNLGGDFIKGVSEFTSGETMDVNVLGVRAVDDRTLEIETVGPAPFLPAFLAGNFTWWPIPRHKYDQHGPEWGLQDDRVFNGPYIIQSWDHNQRMVFARNPEYQGYAARPDELDMTIFADQYGPAVLAAFEAGELDVASVAVPDLERVLGSPAEFNAESVAILLDLNTILINANKPPLDDVRVRQALYMAIDRELISERLFNGTYVPMYKYIVGEQPGADPDARPFPDASVEKARELLAEAGYPNGEGFRELRYISYGGDYVNFVQVLKEMWKENLGIDISIQAGDEAAWVAAIIEIEPDTDWGDLADAFLNQSFLDPAALLESTLDNGGSFYHHHWEMPANLRTQMQEALATQGDERHDKVLEFDLAVTQEVPVIPVHIFTEVYARKPYLSGRFQANGFAWQGLRYAQILEH